MYAAEHVHVAVFYEFLKAMEVPNAVLFLQVKLFEPSSLEQSISHQAIHYPTIRFLRYFCKPISGACFLESSLEGFETLLDLLRRG